MFLLDSAPATWTSQEDRHLQLCRALAHEGILPIFVFSRPLRPDMEARLRTTGAEVYALDYGEGPIHYLRELRRLVRRFSITTAHVVFFDYFSPVPWLARLSGIRRIVYEMQNSGEFRATSWRRHLLRLRTRLMLWPVDRVVAISDFVKGQMVLAGVSSKRIVVRHLGVDTTRFCPDPSARCEWISTFPLRPGELMLSTVSYLRPFKNPDVLVHVCHELSKRGVASRLFVAGDGAMLPGLKALSGQLGVSEQIHWLGNVEDPRRLLQASDVFILASVGEAFGLVLAEAMACGVPVVGSRSGSLPEVVADAETGFLSPPLDVAALADSVERLARDHRLRRQMSAEAVSHVRRRFTVERAVEETLRVYRAMED